MSTTNQSTTSESSWSPAIGKSSLTISSDMAIDTSLDSTGVYHNILDNNTIFNNPLYGYTNTTNNSYVWTTPNKLSILPYNVDFLLDTEKTKLLVDSLTNIEDDYFSFSCDFIGNRIQPYEYIMQLINNKTKFSVKIKISDILTLCYTNFHFTKIKNNFKFNNGTCDFSNLKVNFEFDDILYENNTLSIKEKRVDKLNKIIKKNN